jgi:hypothetical protein
LKGEALRRSFDRASGQDTAPAVLAYLATQPDVKQEVYEATILNTRTPDQALAKPGCDNSLHSSLLELITINQQRLVRCPEIIDAILGNPACAAAKLKDVRVKRVKSFLRKNVVRARSLTSFALVVKLQRQSFSKRRS